MNLDNRKKTLIGAASVFGVVLVWVLGTFFFTPGGNKEEIPERAPDGETLIVDLATFFNDIPDNSKWAVQTTLYNTLLDNGVKSGIRLADAYVREGSVEENYDQSTDVHWGGFIVDIPKVSQSYALQFEWSSDEYNINLSGYNALVTCLSIDQLIYGYFDCKEPILSQY
jgi:hypothetical protein